MNKETLIASLKSYYLDQSRPASETLETLEEIRDEIDGWIEGLKFDVEKEDGE
jgi:hypothetical protein